jgi:hypothetical protein
MPCQLSRDHDGPCGPATDNALQTELLDLIVLMPDSQVDEILAFVTQLRLARKSKTLSK